jgi:hypothetical protein
VERQQLSEGVNLLPPEVLRRCVRQGTVAVAFPTGELLVLSGT